MDNMLKNSLEKTFYYHKEFHLRVEKKWYKDTIYRGMFAKTLYDLKYTDKELEYAEQNNWIRLDLAQDSNGTHRTAYLWLLKEMPQRKTFKIIIDYVKKLISGEFNEYYGPVWKIKDKN